MKTMTWKQSLAGRKATIIQNQRSASSLRVGEIVTIEKFVGTSDGYQYATASKDGNTSKHNVYLMELEFEDITIETLQNEATELKNKLSEINAKIEFLQKSGLKNYDDDVAKAYRVINLLNLGGDNAMQKAEELIKIINEQ